MELPREPEVLEVIYPLCVVHWLHGDQHDGVHEEVLLVHVHFHLLGLL